MPVARRSSAASMGVKSKHYRSPGENTAERRETIKKLVDTAYWKAEEQQWHTKDERQSGNTLWTGGNVHEGGMETKEEEAKCVCWSEYRKPGQFSDIGGGPWKKEPIIPTCPPHPVGEPAATASRGGGNEEKWGQVIKQWVEEVRKEDEKRKNKKWTQTADV